MTIPVAATAVSEEPSTLRIEISLAGGKRIERTVPEPLPPSSGSRILVEKGRAGVVTFTIPFRRRPGVVATLALAGVTSSALAAILGGEDVPPAWPFTLGALGLSSFGSAFITRFGATRITVHAGCLRVRGLPFGFGRSWSLPCRTVRFLTRHPQVPSQVQLVPRSGSVRRLGPPLPTTGEAEWLEGELWKLIRAWT